MYLNSEHFTNFLHEKEITWLGIDFSKAKFTKKGFEYPQEVLEHYMTAWNMLIISDQKRYDIRLSFRKPIMQYDLSAVTKKNKAIKASQLLCNNINVADFYTEADIKSYIEQQSFPQNTAYALTVVVEAFDAKTKLAALWLVLLKAATSEVVLCEKFLKEPGGFGIKNYWGRTFYNLFFDVNKYAFPRWENAIQENNIIHHL